VSAARPDYYTVLGLARSATGAEIKAAYRRLALRHRPDLVVSPEWRAVAAAYRVLGDENRRALYDQGLDPYVRSPQHLARVEEGAAAVTAFLGLDRPPDNPRGTDVAALGRHHIRYHRYLPCRDCHASGQAEGSDWATCRRCRGVGEYQRRRLVWLGGMSFGWLVGGAICDHCQGSRGGSQGRVSSLPRQRAGSAGGAGAGLHSSG
jgi:DnaJ-class molecular chaperone